MRVARQDERIDSQISVFKQSLRNSVRISHESSPSASSDQAYACPGETAKAAEQLRQTLDLIDAARDVAHGLVRRGGGAASGKPGSQPPGDLDAMERLGAVQASLGTWARHISEIRGIEIATPSTNGGKRP